MGERKRVRVVVSGSVQGVGFRYWASAEAERLHLAGWVANRPDGTVVAEAEGDEASVDSFLAWLGHGPRYAEVTDVESSDIPLENGHGFRIEQ